MSGSLVICVRCKLTSPCLIAKDAYWVGSCNNAALSDCVSLPNNVLRSYDNSFV